MQTPTRRDLLAGLASLAALGRGFLGLLLGGPTVATATAPVRTPAPGKLRVEPPSQSVMRRG